MLETREMESMVSLDGLSVRLGAPRSHGGLTVIPLLSESEPELPYLLLIDAINSGTLTLSEIGSGSVPNLLARNEGRTDVLILDGEQLIGAKQNRITNRSILLGAGTVSEIPVSCMEQGRWRFTSETFAPSPRARHAPSGVRRHARDMEVAVAVARGRGSRDAAAVAQAAVWGSISALSNSLGGRSPTGAMDDVYERRHEDVDAWLQHYPPDPGQVGIAAFLDDRPLALDAVGCPGLWWRVHARFLGGYVMDALARRGGRKPRASDAVMPGPEAAERFLADVSTARRIDSDTVGCGRYRVLSGSAIGAELVDDRHGASRLAHLSAYPSPVDRRS